MKPQVLLTVLLVLAVGLLAGLTSVMFWQPEVFAQAAVLEVNERIIDPEVQKWGYMAAALSTAIAALGAAYAVAHVGAAAVGAITEKPEMFGRVLILVGLAEGIVIYGLIISVLILTAI
jgi:V/A-type H+-transporting ATPase subunit K